MREHVKLFRNMISCITITAHILKNTIRINLQVSGNEAGGAGGGIYTPVPLIAMTTIGAPVTTFTMTNSTVTILGLRIHTTAEKRVRCKD